MAGVDGRAVYGSAEAAGHVAQEPNVLGGERGVGGVAPEVEAGPAAALVGGHHAQLAAGA